MDEQTSIGFLVLLAVVGALKFQPSEKPHDISAKEPLDAFENIPRKGTVSMLDLGADACIPCKMMAPIMAKLEKEYKGRADIIFIDDINYRPNIGFYILTGDNT